MVSVHNPEGRKRNLPNARQCGAVLAMLVSKPLHPLLDGLKFRSPPAGFPCCSDGVARRQCRAAGKLFSSQTLAIIEMKPKWNASGSTTHLIGTRHRKPGVRRTARLDGPSTLGRETDWKQKFAMAQETDMQTPRKQGIVRDDRGQTQPADKQRAQQSQMEGPAAYAPHEGEKKANPKRDPAKKKTGHESE